MNNEKIKVWHIYCTVSFEDRRPIISTKLIESYKRHTYIPHQGWNDVNDPIISYDGVLYPTYELYFSENTSKEKLEKVVEILKKRTIKHMKEVIKKCEITIKKFSE